MESLQLPSPGLAEVFLSLLSTSIHIPTCSCLAWQQLICSCHYCSCLHLFQHYTFGPWMIGPASSLLLLSSHLGIGLPNLVRYGFSGVRLSILLLLVPGSLFSDDMWVIVSVTGHTISFWNESYLVYPPLSVSGGQYSSKTASFLDYQPASSHAERSLPTTPTPSFSSCLTPSICP